MSLIATTRRQVLRQGAAITLRRVQTGVAPIEVQPIAVVRGYVPHEMLGGIVQGDRQVTITNDEIAAAGWPAPPRKGDQVVIDGKAATVQGVNTTTLRGAIAKHVLHVRG